jgi:hypothetical protein
MSMRKQTMCGNEESVGDKPVNDKGCNVSKEITAYHGSLTLEERDHFFRPYACSFTSR